MIQIVSCQIKRSISFFGFPCSISQKYYIFSRCYRLKLYFFCFDDMDQERDFSDFVFRFARCELRGRRKLEVLSFWILIRKSGKENNTLKRRNTILGMMAGSRLFLQEWRDGSQLRVAYQENVVYLIFFF